MGYEINEKAYRLFTEIEVGIREFFIYIVKEKGVNDWMNDFLGSDHRSNLNEFIKSINEKHSKKEELSACDVFVLKLNRERKIKDSLGQLSSEYYHPFYYLNWTDMEKLIITKSNSKLFLNYIDNATKDLLIENLRSLTYLRNDIAHSRFINENELKFIESVVNQIANIIPNFNQRILFQSKEESVKKLKEDMLECITILRGNDILPISTITRFREVIKLSTNSFWLNTFSFELVNKLNDLLREIDDYELYRRRPGGLLYILKWKEKNNELILKTISLLGNGKI